LIGRLIEASPPGSLVVVEADESLDFRTLPLPDLWDVHEYRPAIVGIIRLGGE
jgi:hypothetical protein